MTQTRTFVRDSKIVEMSELRDGDTFYFYDGPWEEVTEYRLMKARGRPEDGKLWVEPLAIIQLKAKDEQHETVD